MTMAEAGVPDVSLSTGSEAVFDIVCLPCSKDGQHKEAVSYCCDCRGHLCRDCVNDHKDIRSLKHHQLIEKVTRDVNKIRASHVAEIIMNSTNKTKTSFFQMIFGTQSTYYCWITGMTMVGDDKVVAVDNHLCTIKLIDTANNAIVSDLKVEDGPGDVTTCNNTVAVTLPSVSKIVFLKHTGGLAHDREISVNGRCNGLDWYNDKLYVIFSAEKKLEVMTPLGVVLQTFSTSVDGQPLFHRPGYVTVNDAYQRIFVSELYKGRLVVLDMAGNQTGTYVNDELGRPKQLAINRAGVMFLCDRKSDTVHLLSPAGEKANVLLTKQDGVNDPFAVCYCENTGRLYIGMRNCDTIKVYKLSYENL